MTFEVNKPSGWSVQRCRYISESYLDLFLSYVERQSVQHGGRFDAQTLRTLASEFQMHDDLTALALSRSFSDCNSARLSRRHQDRRKDHLGRLLVQQFVPLFVEMGGPAPSRGGLSHEVLPGFFYAMALAFGGDNLARYRHRCNEIVERLQAATGDDFDWRSYFEDAEAKEVLLDVLISFVRTFANFERRKRWFIDIINKERPSPPGTHKWMFCKVHFQTMARALLNHLKIAVDGSETRRRITRKYGRSTVAEIEIFLEHIS